MESWQESRQQKINTLRDTKMFAIKRQIRFLEARFMR